MNRITAILLLSIITSAGICQNPHRDTILLFHPTVANISTLAELIEKEILLLDNFHFQGLFHSTEGYDYGKSFTYLNQHPDLSFSLKEITGVLPPEDLFKQNNCTAEITAQYASSVGAIFMGGPDIPPSTYGEPMHLLTGVTDPGRHYFELSFLFHLLGGSQNEKFSPLMSSNQTYVVLGICLGMQSINVATGGTLIQDIPQEIYGFSYQEELLSANPETVHRNYHFDDPADTLTLTGYHFHPIRLLHGEILANEEPDISGNKFPSVLSSHHQAIEKPGLGIRIAATSIDGKITEVICHEKYPNVTGVQFHPEKTALYDADQIMYISSDSTLSFFNYLKATDSDRFHRVFWKRISEMFSRVSSPE